jgi:hypothetical protein
MGKTCISLQTPRRCSGNSISECGNPHFGQFKRDVKLADRRGFRDLHIEPDWLLLYSLDGDVVR